MKKQTTLKLYLESDIKVKLSGFTEKITTNSKDLRVATLKELEKVDKSNCHWNIIFHHGGEEYTIYPSPTKRNLLKRIRNKV
ncbi:MAG: hypothetical protein MZV64_70965 [Ignavibacteriales bacterium]|nr:hypothetical protein [Ignavibacteriales bacterium]